jgi:hypothetical protein
MHQTVAGWIMLAGGVTAFVAAQAAGIVTFRYMRAQRNSGDRAKRAVIVLEGVHSALRFTVVAALGILAIVLGAVFGYGAEAWTLILPMIILVGALLASWRVRRSLTQLRRSA